MHPIFRVIQWSLRSSMAPLRVSFSRFCTAPTGLSGGGVCSTAAVHRPASCWPMHCTQCCTLQARGLLKPGTRRWPAQPLVYRCTQTADAAGLDQHCSAVERRAMEPCARFERRPCWPQQRCCRKILCYCSRGDPEHDGICANAFKRSTVSGLRGVRPYFQHSYRLRTSSKAYTGISTGFFTWCVRKTANDFPKTATDFPKTANDLRKTVN